MNIKSWRTLALAGFMVILMILGLSACVPTDDVDDDPPAQSWQVVYSAGTGGTISGTASQTVANGQSGTEVTAVPNAGYAFVAWDDGVTTAARQDTNVTANINVTAQFREAEVPVASLRFTLIDGVNAYSVSGIEETEGTIVTIPSIFNNVPVISIGDYAFSGRSGLTSITIPDSVTGIGDYAFSGCSGLTNITIPDSVTGIGDYAFRGCSGLTSIALPFVGSSRTATDSSSLFGYIFGNSSYTGGKSTQQYYASSSSTSYYIPTSLKTVVITDATQLSYGAFYNCSELTSITIPDSVTNIGDRAFYGCSGLTSITLPFVGATKDGTTNTHFGYIFGASSYSSNSSYVPSSLKTVVITGGASIGSQAFAVCGSLTSITIPDSVTGIGEHAFLGCSGLTIITVASGNSKYHSAGNCLIETATKTLILGCKASIIPTDGSVTSIGEGAFYFCNGLTSIIIPAGVTSIGDYAFYGCSGLTNITIPNSVTSIGSFAFSVCSGLTSITIPNSVTSIGSSAFSRCSGLTSITIPNSVTSIGDYAFYGCSGLTSITIPDSVTSIGDSAFRGCSGLTSITLPFVGSSRTATGSNGLFGYIFGTLSYTGGTATMQYYTSSSYTTYYIPTSLKTVVITDATQLSYGAFYNCSGLTSATIPDSVTYIGSYAFYDCSGLTSITIPEGVTSIGNYAFSGCYGLTIYCKANSQPSGWNANWNSSNRPVVWGA